MKILKETYEIKELNEGGLSRIWQNTQDESCFAIIGSKDKDTGKDRFGKLKDLVSNLSIGYEKQGRNKVGYRILIGTYTYNDGTTTKEKSLLINGISFKDALNIARKINQESIIYKDNINFGLFDCDTGSNIGNFSTGIKNMDFSSEDIELFSSRFEKDNPDAKRNFKFVVEEISPATGSNAIKNFAKIETIRTPLFEIDKNWK